MDTIFHIMLKLKGDYSQTQFQNNHKMSVLSEHPANPTELNLSQRHVALMILL